MGVMSEERDRFRMNYVNAFIYCITMEKTGSKFQRRKTLSKVHLAEKHYIDEL